MWDCRCRRTAGHAAARLSPAGFLSCGISAAGAHTESDAHPGRRSRGGKEKNGSEDRREHGLGERPAVWGSGNRGSQDSSGRWLAMRVVEQRRRWLER